MKSKGLVDGEGWMHAEWCADPQHKRDACDCSPCNMCEGYGQYGGDDGETMDCLECANEPHLTHKKPRRR